MVNVKNVPMKIVKAVQLQLIFAMLKVVLMDIFLAVKKALAFLAPQDVKNAKLKIFQNVLDVIVAIMLH